MSADAVDDCAGDLGRDAFGVRDGHCSSTDHGGAFDDERRRHPAGNPDRCCTVGPINRPPIPKVPEAAQPIIRTTYRSNTARAASSSG